MECILVFLGGGIGTILRYLLTLLSDRHFGIGYPWGTFLINIIGSLFLGFIVALALNKTGVLNSNLKLFLTIGLAGGFTTFSTFSYESLALIKNGQILSSMAYLILSPVIGLSAVYFGTYLTKYLD